MSHYQEFLKQFVSHEPILVTLLMILGATSAIKKHKSELVDACATIADLTVLLVRGIVWIVVSTTCTRIFQGIVDIILGGWAEWRRLRRGPPSDPSDARPADN